MRACACGRPLPWPKRCGPLEPARLAPGVEPGQGCRRPLVAGDLQGGGQHRPVRPCLRPEGLGRQQSGQAQGGPGWASRSSRSATPGARAASAPGPWAWSTPATSASPHRHRAHQGGDHLPGGSHRYWDVRGILSATLTEHAGRWYVSFGCEVSRQVGSPTAPAQVVGVDVGVRNLAVLSTGEVVPNPRALARSSRALARHQRRLARQEDRRRGRTRLKALPAQPQEGRPHPRQGGPPASRWPAQADHTAGDHVRHRGGGGPERGRHVCPARSPARSAASRPPPAQRGPSQVRAQPGHPRCRPRRAPPPARLQVRVARIQAGGGRSLVPQLQDLLNLSDSENLSCRSASGCSTARRAVWSSTVTTTQPSTSQPSSNTSPTVGRRRKTDVEGRGRRLAQPAGAPR